MIIVSALLSFSVSSATTRSLSSLCISLLRPIWPAWWAGRRRWRARAASPVRLGWSSAFRLPAVFGAGVFRCGLRRDFDLGELVDDSTRDARIDVDAGAHRGGDGDLLDVAPLRGGGLRPDDLLDQGGVVLDQLALVEAPLADWDVDVRAAVGAVLELARLRVPDGLAYVEGHGSGLRVRHQPARAEDATEPA